MAESLATRASRGHRTLCLPFAKEAYLQIIHGLSEFRRAIDERSRTMHDLFPAHFGDGYRLKDDRISAKNQIPIRRVLLKDGIAYGVRPSFLMPYMTAGTDDVEGPLFLRKFAVPFWALARASGAQPRRFQGTISCRIVLRGQSFAQFLRGQLEELPEAQFGQIQAQSVCPPWQCRGPTLPLERDS